MMKPRSLAYGLIFVLCAGAPQVINADEAGGLLENVAPATNRSSAASTATLQDTPLVVALADPKVAAPNTTLSLPSTSANNNRSWPTPARFFTINQVLAKRENGPSPVKFASIRPTDSRSDRSAIQIPPTQGDEPFGLYTFRAPNGLLSEKWRKVEADIQAEGPALSRCRAEPDQCTPAAARFVAIIKLAKTMQGRAKIELVNRKINDAFRYSSDIAQWGVPDRWSAPLDVNNKGSFETGLGDCEDYAIAKYVALQQAGVPVHDLRVLLVRDKVVRMDHAVLALRSEGRWLILDNRFSALLEENDARFFVPLFALDSEGVKLFAAPYASNGVGVQTGTYSDDSGQSITVGTEALEVSVAPLGTIASGLLPLLL